MKLVHSFCLLEASVPLKNGVSGLTGLMDKLPDMVNALSVVKGEGNAADKIAV